MRVLHFQQWCGAMLSTSISFLQIRGAKSSTTKLLLISMALFSLATVHAESPHKTCEACDNVVNGGAIGSDEFGCPNPTWDPSAITSLAMPTGGTGTLEFIWMVTTDDPSSPLAQWAPIPNTNSPSYDPGPISVTTYYRRCSRRSGCNEYTGETNIVKKEALCCDNVTDGGSIGSNQTACLSPFDPALLTNVASPTGGSNVLEYQWVVSNSGSPYTASNPDWTPIAGANSEIYDPGSLSQTTYFVRLARRHGCLVFDGVSNMVTILISDNLSASAVADSVTCFGGNDGSIDLTTSGGTTPYTYLWTGGLGTNADPTTVAAGIYSVTVTDANGCTATASATVVDGDQVVVTADATDETCNGAHNGTASILSANGGLAPYSFTWGTAPTQAGLQIANLAPANYAVTATDAQGCTATTSVTVGAGPNLTVFVSATDVICFGKNQGTATVDSVSNGTGNFSYIWSAPTAPTSAAINNLLAGSYTVTVSDDEGCSGTATATIADGPQIIVNPSHTNATCNYTQDGSATALVSGGVPPYNYLWDDPAAQTTATADQLAAGTYHVSITDANGCTTASTVTVEAPIPAEITTDSTNVSCFNGTDGIVSVTVTNGNPTDYYYLWNDPNASTTSTATGLAAGTYNVTVSDDNGCLVTESVSISQPSELIISVTSTNATCGNGSDGTVTVSVSGGTPGYSYNWSLLGSPNVDVLDDVSPGTYTVTVTDANGCSKIGTATISAPPALVVNLTTSNITCHGMANGQIIAGVTGGIGNYTYAWDDTNSSTGTSITNLGPGVYTITVTDGIGCSAFASSTVTEPSVLTVAMQKIDVDCANDTDGSALALPTGGTAPYSYAWASGQTTQNISNLGTGNYVVTVTDINGCTTSGAVQIISTTTLAMTATATDAHCFTSNDGAAMANVTGATVPVTYQWSNGAVTPNNPNLSAGTYTVTVTDGDGCTVTASAMVASPPALTSAATVVTPISSYNGSNGSVKVTPNGGVSPYTVVWNNASTSLTLTDLPAGTYFVTTTDANGCTASNSVNLVNPSKIGDFVWLDANQNGVQDSGEPGVGGVTLHLTGASFNGVQLHLTTVSDNTGFYNFDGIPGGNYQIMVELPNVHVFSPANIGSDLTDSDINASDSSTAVFLLPVSTYDSRWDVGLIELDEKINIGDFVWQDADHDGIQDPLEQGIPNYTVRLYSMPSNTLVATKVTNASGKYLFTDVLPGLYQIEFLLANLPNGYTYSPANIGTNDNIDSDPDPLTGRTATFQVFPYTVDNLTLDAGVFKECDNVTDGGLIGYNENLCGNGADPAEIVSLGLPTGGFGVLEYLWLKSTVPVYNGPGDVNWSPIPNSNAPNYDPGPISQSTYYIRCARRAGCPDYPGETNIVSKLVTPNPLAQIIDQPTTLCTYVGGRFEAAIAGGGATYNWNFGTDATPTAAATRVVNPVSWSTEGTKPVSLTVTRFGCSVTVNTTVGVTLCPNPIIIVFDDITAEAQSGKIELKWHVSGYDPEQTVFFIQRSEDGVNFENMDAMGGTETESDGTFRFMDEHPRLGENIYRIHYRQFGESITEGQSGMASAFNQPEGVRSIQVYPNPTQGNVTLEFLNLSPKPTAIELNDAFGRVVFSTTVPEQTEKKEIDMRKLPIGVYWMRIYSENVREQIVKVVKSE